MSQYFGQIYQIYLPRITLDELRTILAKFVSVQGEDKFTIFNYLVSRAQSREELKYVMKFVQGSLRIGIAQRGLENLIRIIINDESIPQSKQ